MLSKIVQNYNFHCLKLAKTEFCTVLKAQNSSKLNFSLFENGQNRNLYSLATQNSSKLKFSFFKIGQNHADISRRFIKMGFRCGSSEETRVRAPNFFHDFLWPFWAMAKYELQTGYDCIICEIEPRTGWGYGPNWPSEAVNQPLCTSKWRIKMRQNNHF